jgi:molybdopterin-guanine dinucleotide biosynthesis protein A
LAERNAAASGPAHPRTPPREPLRGGDDIGPPEELAWDAVVLAGGGARRLGGVDKPATVVGGQTLLDRVLAAAATADTAVVVGPARPVAPGMRVRWTRERPPGGGPLAGIAAGLRLVTAPFVAVLAADLPFLTAADLGRLRAAVTDEDDEDDEDDEHAEVAMLVDPTGRWQPLAAVWRTDALRRAMPATPDGMPVRSLFAGRRVVGLPGGESTCLDCDTPADLAIARAWAGSAAGTGRRAARVGEGVGMDG